MDCFDTYGIGNLTGSENKPATCTGYYNVNSKCNFKMWKSAFLLQLKLGSRTGVAEWFMQRCSKVGHGFNPHQCLWTHNLQVCGSKRISCHADLHTVSRYCTRGEFENHTDEKVHKGSTLALKARTDVTRSPKPGF